VRGGLGGANCERIFYVGGAVKAGVRPEEIIEWSKIDPWFVHQIEEILFCEKKILSSPTNPLGRDLLLEAKRHGFSDHQIAFLRGVTERDVRAWRGKEKVTPAYKSGGPCAAGV